MIVYLANKTRFSEDIISHRIESNILQTGKRVNFIATGTRHRGENTHTSLAA